MTAFFGYTGVMPDPDIKIGVVLEATDYTTEDSVHPKTVPVAPSFEELPLVVVSTSAEGTLVVSVKAFGAVHHIVEPFWFRTATCAVFGALGAASILGLVFWFLVRRLG